jgi:rubrerythrin
MDEGKKKMIMIVVIVVCIVAAVIITVATHAGRSAGGIESIKRGTMVWLKCRDPKCENTWQIDRRDYYDYIDKHRAGFVVPAVVCPKCGGETGYIAEKCGKCGFIFERSNAPNDYSDRCPKCGYSAQEELRKEAGGGQKTTEKQEQN